jgi:hypothetical protein
MEKFRIKSVLITYSLCPDRIVHLSRCLDSNNQRRQLDTLKPLSRLSHANNLDSAENLRMPCYPLKLRCKRTAVRKRIATYLDFTTRVVFGLSSLDTPGGQSCVLYALPTTVWQRVFNVCIAIVSSPQNRIFDSVLVPTGTASPLRAHNARHE